MGKMKKKIEDSGQLLTRSLELPDHPVLAMWHSLSVDARVSNSLYLAGQKGHGHPELMPWCVIACASF